MLFWLFTLLCVIPSVLFALSFHLRLHHSSHSLQSVFIPPFSNNDHPLLGSPFWKILNPPSQCNICTFSQGNYSKECITVVLCFYYAEAHIELVKNWYVVPRIKSVFPKLALLLRVSQRNFFTKLERRVKQRNSPVKNFFHCLKLKLYHF